MDLPGPSRSTTGGYKCALCGIGIVQKRQRKILAKDSAGEVHLQQLRHFCEAVHPGYDIQEVIHRLPREEKYICRVCQDEISKWEKLHAQIQVIQQILSEKVDTMCTGSTTRPPAALPTNLAPKRLKLDPVTSPEVVVGPSHVINLK